MAGDKKFASQADLAEKKVTFERLSEHAYAYTAEGDPNTGIIVGDDAVLVADTQATPVMAEDVIRRIREVTDKPIKYVLLTHYHAVRVLGASAYGADHVIASQDTYDLIVERGAADMKSEIERFPRLFRSVESVPGLTWPTLTFKGEMTLWLGKLEVKIMQLGRGHTKGDTVVWLPQEKVLLSGDLVEYGAPPYAGAEYFQDWPATLDAILKQTLADANEKSNAAKTSIESRLADPVDFAQSEKLIALQTELSDYSIYVSLASTLARKAVSAVETLVKAQ